MKRCIADDYKYHCNTPFHIYRQLMIQLYSKLDPSKLLHQINRLEEIVSRENRSDDEQFLQIATLKMKQGHTFKPHRHIWKPFIEDQIIAQESWVVIRGSVNVSYYDTDGNFITSIVIKQGDCSVTFEGGHTYTILEDDTIVYEHKVGPYTGQQNDKVFI